MTPSSRQAALDLAWIEAKTADLQLSVQPFDEEQLSVALLDHVAGSIKSVRFVVHERMQTLRRQITNRDTFAGDSQLTV